MLLLGIRTGLFVLGLTMTVIALGSAIKTFVLPRSVADPISRQVFLAVRFFFNLRVRRTSTYADRDSIMALFAPVSLLLLLVVWLALVLFGYTLMFRALGAESWYIATRDSGSSLLTLGFATMDGWRMTLLAFTEATIGLILVALLISYLPTMYSAFSRRELSVTLLEVRAGSPPSAVEMIKRFNRLENLDQLSGLWSSWELVVCRDRRNPHIASGAVVFPLATTRPLVDHGGRNGARCRRTHGFHCGCATQYLGGVVFARWLFVVAPDRVVLPLSRNRKSQPDRPYQHQQGRVRPGVRGTQRCWCPA